MSVAYLAEIAAYDVGLPGLTTLRYAASAYGGYSHPSAPGFYAPRIKVLPTFRRDIFGRSTTGGAGQVSQGDLVLANDDGALDGFRDFGLAGQACTILIGDPDGAYSGFQTLIVGRIEQALFDQTEVHIRLKDRLQDLQVLLQPNLYAGSNSLPSGLEGVDDLKGKPKPKPFGQVSNASIVCVNTARLIYQVNDGAVSDVPAVYDAGASLTQGADYVSQADMETTAPAAGTYRVWKAGGYFRLGASPVGTITADILEGAAAGDRTAAQVAERIVTGTGGIASGDVTAGDVTALDTANSSVVGIFLDQGGNFAAALDQVLGSVGAWYGFDRLGKFRMQRLQGPGSPVVTLRQFGIGSDAGVNDLDIVNIRFLPTNDPDKGVPTWQVQLGYNRNYTVQAGNGLAGAVTDARRAVLATDLRNVSSSDSAVKTPSPLAVVKQVETLIVGQSDAQDESDRLLALFKVRRDFVEVDTLLTPAAIAAVDLGSTVSVVKARFGYNSGRPMAVIGMLYNTANRILTLALWG